LLFNIQDQYLDSRTVYIAVVLGHYVKFHLSKTKESGSLICNNSQVYRNNKTELRKIMHACVIHPCFSRCAEKIAFHHKGTLLVKQLCLLWQVLPTPKYQAWMTEEFSTLTLFAELNPL
jgi:hypothetical protein